MKNVLFGGGRGGTMRPCLVAFKQIDIRYASHADRLPYPWLNMLLLLLLLLLLLSVDHAREHALGLAVHRPLGRAEGRAAHVQRDHVVSEVVHEVCVQT